MSTSVVFIGNPGVGKSALLNALGGSFESGMSEIGGLTKTVSSQYVVCNDRSLRLLDVPGIMESGGGNTISGNLKMLEDTLNNAGQAVLFFVITPRNGRVAPDDFAVMKTLLTNLKESPTVGVILTQVRPSQVSKLHTADYYNKILTILQQANVNTGYFESNRFIILPEHDDDFSSAEKSMIREYVLSFTPKRVQTKSLIEKVFKAILDFFKGKWF
ncbi:hypothetical protein BGZ95_004387 [Linnemannia exigua]|uniref:G domain-containing protein n=1 Tax=Linnemannia exigua TaxID=604196 RepID=A0AAD4H0U2_9FUNG|nr:hypothetical protein BGZ95_004387 [Linnemannia exigua]